MPLKDHAKEIQCVTDIATLIKWKAHQKLSAQYQVANAIKAVRAQKIANEKFELVAEVSGVQFGSWA